MEEKSTVGMMNCWICGEGAQIIVKTDLRPTLPQNCGSLPNVICSKCENLAKDSDALWLIAVKDGEVEKEGEIFDPYRTGTMCLVTKQAIKDKIITAMMEGEPKEQMKRIVETSLYLYLDDSTWDAFGLPRQETSDES